MCVCVCLERCLKLRGSRVPAITSLGWPWGRGDAVGPYLRHIPVLNWFPVWTGIWSVPRGPQIHHGTRRMMDLASSIWAAGRDQQPAGLLPVHPSPASGLEELSLCIQGLIPALQRGNCVFNPWICFLRAGIPSLTPSSCSAAQNPSQTPQGARACPLCLWEDDGAAALTGMWHRLC